jgi:TonB family protein
MLGLRLESSNYLQEAFGADSQAAPFRYKHRYGPLVPCAYPVVLWLLISCAIVTPSETYHLSSARKIQMPEQMQRREASTNWTVSKDRRRMFVALTLLLLALIVVLVRNREVWVGTDETTATDDSSPVWNPKTDVQPHVATPAPVATEKKHVAPKAAIKPANLEQPVMASNRAPVPPLEIEVVGSGSNAVKVTMPAESKKAADWGPATVASERMQMASETAPAIPRAVELPYPLLARQMKVQGSVILQAFIGVDGVVQSLRVLSGPAILASAAREAARGWKFRPYLQHGQPVETQATIAVNFSINVLNDGTREQMTLARGGE